MPKSFMSLLKSHFGMSVLLSICCIFSEHLFLRTPLEGCFCMKLKIMQGILLLNTNEIDQEAINLVT